MLLLAELKENPMWQKEGEKDVQDWKKKRKKEMEDEVG